MFVRTPESCLCSSSERSGWANIFSGQQWLWYLSVHLCCLCVCVLSVIHNIVVALHLSAVATPGLSNNGFIFNLEKSKSQQFECNPLKSDVWIKREDALRPFSDRTEGNAMQMRCVLACNIHRLNHWHTALNTARCPTADNPHLNTLQCSLRDGQQSTMAANKSTL